MDYYDYRKISIDNMFDISNMINIIQLDCEKNLKTCRIGKGSKKTVLEKIYKSVYQYIEKEKEYIEHLNIMGSRNSYSKTEHDATFMRLKKDYMKNDKLTPAYNIQIGVNSGYVVASEIYHNPADTNTLIPFLNSIEKRKLKFKNIVADAGYDSYTNLKYLKEKGYISHIKPNSYEKDKKKVIKNNKDYIYNLRYDKDNNIFIREDDKVYEEKFKSKKGYSFFENSEGNYFSTNIEAYILRRENYDNVKSEEGIIYRVNRSIQVEGVFANIKGNFNVERFKRKGKDNVRFEMILYCLGYNLRKYIGEVKRDKKTISLYNIKNYS